MYNNLQAWLQNVQDKTKNNFNEEKRLSQIAITVFYNKSKKTLKHSYNSQKNEPL